MNTGFGDLGDRQVGKMTLVTVVFEAEIPLLSLQARSLAEFISTDDFDAVLVIDNTRRGLSRRQRAALSRHYGPWREKVRFLRPDDITPLPDARGWMGQQVLKMMIHRHVRTPYYLVLDAKNHWVRATSPDVFVNPDGRVRGGRHSYRAHPLQGRLVRVLKYLDIDPEPWLDNFPVTHTPVVLSTEVAGLMTSDIAERGGRSFAAEFIDSDLTEFFLYAGWLVAQFGTLDGHIDGTVVRSATVWPREARAGGFGRALREVRELDPPFVAIHRTALARADFDATRRIAEFWVERGLFPTRLRALAFVASYKLRYVVTMSLRKARLKLARTGS